MNWMYFLFWVIGFITAPVVWVIAVEYLDWNLNRYEKREQAKRDVDKQDYT